MSQNAQSRAIIERLRGNIHGGMCVCPTHDDRGPSLHVTGKSDGKVLLHCHAGCPQEDLITWCKEHGLWHSPMRRVINFRPAHEQRQRQQQQQQQQEDSDNEEQQQQDDSNSEQQQEDSDEQQQQEDSDRARRRTAYYVLRIAAKHAAKEKKENPDAGNQLLPYFNGRGITAVPPGAMYLPSEIVSQIIRAYPECGLKRFPCMAVATCDAQGRLRGAQVTQLSRDSRSNLRIDGKSVRRIVGPAKHAFVQVGAWPTRDRPLLAAEGVEKAAAVAQLLKEQDYPAIATLGTANMRSNMPLPPCREVIIPADNGAAGTKAAEAMAGHIKRAGGTARIVFPPEQFKDWDEAIKAADNDTLASYREMFLSAPAFDGEGEEDATNLAPTMEQVVRMEIPPLDYLLQPWLTTSSIGEVHAQRGVGKTRFMMGTAHALASGQNFLRWRVKRPVRVLYVDGELPAAVLQARLRLLGAPTANLTIVSRDLLLRQNVVLPDLNSDEGRAFLDPIIEALQIEAIVLDSLSTLIYSGKEVDPEDWMPIQRWLMAHRFRGRAIIFLHHEGWLVGRARGTSKREDVIDYSIGLKAKDADSTEESKEAATFELNFTKKRELIGKDAAPLLLHVSTVAGTSQWRWEFAGNRVGEQIKELHKQGVKQKEIAKELGLTQGAVSKILRKVIAAAGTEAAP